MKKLSILIAAAATTLAFAPPATAQRFGGSFRAPTPVYRAPPPVYRAPVTVSRPAPATTYRAAPTITRPAPVTRPVVQTRTTTTVTTTRATGPAARPMAPRASLHAPVLPARARPAPASAHQEANILTSTQRTRAPIRRSYAYRGASWSWTAPYAMPIWWMLATHRPYSYEAYDDFIRQCLRTPRPRRSRECVRALRERRIEG